MSKYLDLTGLTRFWNAFKARLLPSGGSSGQVLAKASGTDWDLAWANAQGIEYIVGTQTAATNVWTGVTVDSTLRIGKVIAYKLPYAGNNSAATLNLTLAGGSTTGAKALRRQGGSTVTTHFAVNNVIVMIYDGTYWRVSAYYDGNTNTVPTGYCTTGAATAAKSATCTYGYRDDANYFPCLFRYANTASNATLAIDTYATDALPIYVNGARTSSSNTFGAGVIIFLYYNNAYYCYNDGRFPIVVDGAVTSVQEAIAANAYTLPTASTSTLGGVMVDGSTITITDGVISSSGGGGGGTSPSPYGSNPEMDGTASAGTSDDYARGDHVHPTDTSRQAALTVETGTLSKGSAASSYSSSLTRYGKVVTLDMYSLKLASALASGSTSGTVATVPTGYRPATNAYVAIGSTGAHGGSYARITTAGVVTIRNSSGSSIATSAELCLTVTYMTS